MRTQRQLQLISMENYFRTEEEKQEKLNICLSCEHLFQPTKTCKKCGCFMDLKTKLKNTVCPIGKW